MPLVPLEAQFLRALHALSSPGLDALFLWSHYLGSTRTWQVIITAAVLLCCLRRSFRLALTWLVLGLGVDATQKGLKLLIGRARPALWPHPIPHPSPAMPSGHALAAAAFYGFAAYLLARRLPAHARRFYLLAGALAFYVGLGRLYLGVHWPSDVLAGWAIGAGYAWLASRRSASPPNSGRLPEPPGVANAR